MSKSLVELLDAYLPEQEKEKPPYQIYCDMDGVLCDFMKRFEHFTGYADPQEYDRKYGSVRFWQAIDQEVGVKFWSDMDWMPGGKELWNFIAPYKPELLTAPSKNEVSRIGKSLWVRNNITQQPKVNFAYSPDKQKFAHENAILIDDKKSNLREWEAAGGIAIRCVYGNIAPVLEKLRELGYE